MVMCPFEQDSSMPRDLSGHWLDGNTRDHPFRGRAIDTRMNHLNQCRRARDHPLVLNPSRCQPCRQLPIAQDRLGEPVAVKDKGHAALPRITLCFTSACQNLSLGGDLFLRDRTVLGFGSDDELVEFVPLDLALHSRLDASGTPRRPTRPRTAPIVPLCIDTETTVVGPSPGGRSSAMQPVQQTFQ